MKRSGDRFLWAAGIAGVSLSSAILLVAVAYFSFLRPRTPIRALRNLPVASAVHLTGVVTYTDHDGNRFWMEDESGSAVIPVNPERAGIYAGETVTVAARKDGRYDPSEGPASLDLEDARVRSSSTHVNLPAPFHATLTSFPSAEKNGALVEMDGVIEDARTDGSGRVWLSLTGSGTSIDAVIERPDADYSRMLDSMVRVTGVAEQVRAEHGGLLPRIWVPASSGVRLLEAAPRTTALDSIRDLYRQKPSTLGHRIRMRGQVAAVYADSILLEDRWGAIECRLSGPPPFLPGAAVEVVGYPHSDGLRFDLFYAQARKIPAAQLEAAAGAVPPALTSVVMLRDLPAAQAALALPVHITGVITFIDSIWGQLYLQDQTAGIYVKYSGSHPELHAGDRVLVTGISNSGNYAPVIVAPKFQLEGPGALPVPVQATSEQATAGLLDSQYVSIEGVVHPIKFAEQPDHPVFTFELYTSLGQVHVFTSPGFTNLLESHSLEDARVRIQGVFSTVFNSRRQLVGYQLEISSPSHIQVIEPAVPNPFEMQATPIGSLLRYSPGVRYGHRVKVAGFVTLAQNNLLYLQDESGGVEVRGDARAIHLGERIEAIGYPTLVGRYSPVITDAEFRPFAGPRSSAGLLPRAVEPQRTDAESILHGNYDSQLVTLQGRLLTVLPGQGSINLLLQSGIQSFTAELDTVGTGDDLLRLRTGSVLQLTGVSSAQIEPDKVYRLLQEDPVSFKLLLRVPEDVKVVRAAPFWTSQRTLAMMALLSLLMVGILAWVGVLRRRVGRQRIALEKASQTAQAIRDLSTAMEEVSADQKFEMKVSVRGSEEIAGLVVGFNTMLAQLLQKDRARRDAEARLQHQAMVDELTGLPNRRLLADRLAQSMARAHREKTSIGFLYVDLDGFKLVNDSLGHAAGDQLLIEVGQRLRSRVRQADTLARIGGDEFTVILNHIESREDAQRVAQSILQSLVKPFRIEGHEITVGASIGISIFPDLTSENDNLLQQADSAMYAAKRAGKNQIVHFSNDLGISVRERLTLENELRRAIVNGEIYLHYQPEFDLATNTIVRFEALARWTHANLGVIPPLSFIPIAEECGLIVSLGSWVMEQACGAALSWQDAAGYPVQVAVNVSSAQFAREPFVDEVVEILMRTGLPATLLQIELTESATLIGIQRAASTMQRLKDLGISVVMDDFGSGYSCLSYLPKLPFDALKIDRSFVSELLTSAETRALVQSILALGHNLGMRIIVEGIESEEQLRLVQELGGDEAQGYLLGRPGPDAIAVLRSQATKFEARQDALPITSGDM